MADAAETGRKIDPRSDYEQAVAEYRQRVHAFEHACDDGRTSFGTPTWSRRDTERKIAAEELRMAGRVLLMDAMDRYVEAAAKDREAGARDRESQEKNRSAQKALTVAMVVLTFVIAVSTALYTVAAWRAVPSPAVLSPSANAIPTDPQSPQSPTHDQ